MNDPARPCATHPETLREIAPKSHGHTDGASHITTPMLYGREGSRIGGGDGEAFHGTVVFIWSGLGTVSDGPMVAGVSSSLSLHASV